MKNLIFVFSITLLLLIGNIYSMDSFKTCESYCNKLTGQARYKCLTICLKVEKKKKKSSNNTKQAMKDCENICKIYSGLDRVRCLRICLDKHHEKSGKRVRKSYSSYNECEDRCRYLQEPQRFECIKKCRRTRGR